MWPIRRLAALTGLLGALVAGCGVDETGVVSGGVAISVASKQTGVYVCLIGPDGIEIVHRPDIPIGPPSTLPLHQVGDNSGAMPVLRDLLVAGPTPEERSLGLSTEVPPDVELAVVDLAAYEELVNGTGVVDAAGKRPLDVAVDSAFLPPTELATEQITCTLESYLGRFGIAAEVTLYDANDRVVPLWDIGRRLPGG